MAQYVYTMHRLGKIVPPKREILKDISLSFFPGAKIGVLGLNGSGKSTLMNILGALDQPTSGAYFLDGEDVIVAAYDFTGKQLWLSRPGRFKSQWGFSHPPLLFEGKVIVGEGKEGKQAFLEKRKPVFKAR